MDLMQDRAGRGAGTKKKKKTPNHTVLTCTPCPLQASEILASKIFDPEYL